MRKDGTEPLLPPRTDSSSIPNRAVEMELRHESPTVTKPPEAEALYGSDGLPRAVLLGAVWIASVVLLFTVVSLAAYLWSSTLNIKDTGAAVTGGSKLWLQWLTACWAFWVVAPPLWFSFEYFLYKKAVRPGSFAALKYGQEQATKVWAAIVVVLGAVLLKSFK